jgi:hypothetical protein
MKAKMLFGMALLATIVVAIALAEPSQSTAMQQFMRQKLEHSKGVLEGLATENYDLIARHAQKMRAMTQESGWIAYENPGYAVRMDLFRRNVDTLAKSAADRNLDGATLAYYNVTMSCVDCHKFVRGKMTAMDRGDRSSAVATK